MRFQGDIIITDPAYVAKDAEDWRASAYGDNMEALGIQTYLIAEVIEGEEDLAAYDSQNGASLGTFVTDSGVVGVFLLKEILEYDPDFDEHTVCPENALWIPNFDGEIKVTGADGDQHFVGAGSHCFETR